MNDVSCLNGPYSAASGKHQVLRIPSHSAGNGQEDFGADFLKMNTRLVEADEMSELSKWISSRIRFNRALLRRSNCFWFFAALLDIAVVL